LETHRGQATPEAGAAALAYGRLMGSDGLGHQAAARRALVEALRTVAGLETVLAATGNPNGEFREAGGGCLDAEEDIVLVRAPAGRSMRPRPLLRLVLTGCALRVRARPWVLGGIMRAGPEVRAVLHGADERPRPGRTLPGRRRGLRAPARGRLRAGAGGAGVRGALDHSHRQGPGARGVRAAAAADGGRAGPPPPPPLPPLGTFPLATDWGGACAAA
jgi:hypothetical protein